MPATAARLRSEVQELRELEGQVKYLAERVEDLTENQEFLTRLLEARPSSGEAAQIEDTRR